MKKLAIILDSFCAKPVKELMSSYEDHYYLSLKVILDGKEYKEGVNPDNKEILKLINKADDIKTSLPAPAETEELFKKLSKEYENTIYLTVGSALSGTYQTAKTLADNLENVHVINNNLVGQAFFELSTWLKNNETKPIEELLKKCNGIAFHSPTYIIPKNNEAFIKGGRLGRAAAFLLEKTKTVPIIGYEGPDKLYKKMIKRSGKKAIVFAIEKLEKFLKDNPNKNWKFNIHHTLDEEYSQLAKSIIEQKGYELTYDISNGVVVAHTGDGAFSVGVYEKLV